MALSEIQEHSRGTDVRIAQQLLNSALHRKPGLSCDGQYGHLTRLAVMDFQRLRHIEADGVVGPQTWAALQGMPAHAAATPAAAPARPTPPPEPVTAGAEPRWLKIALAELGIHERTALGSKRIVEYHQATTLHAQSDQVPWCSSFVNWCLAQAGLTGTRSAAASSWATWGSPLSEPRLGCIVQLHHGVSGYTSATGTSSGNHVAFFMSKDASQIRLLGGNQSDSVKFSNFPLNKWSVRAYRWPTGA